MIEAGRNFASSLAIDSIIGLGGGSSMDCAKGINFLLTNGGRIHDYRGYGKASKPMLPMIGIPTTAGTGSEAQSYALISDAGSHVKMACGDPKAAFRLALLDPRQARGRLQRPQERDGLRFGLHADRDRAGVFHYLHGHRARGWLSPELRGAGRGRERGLSGPMSPSNATRSQNFFLERPGACWTGIMSECWRNPGTWRHAAPCNWALIMPG